MMKLGTFLAATFAFVSCLGSGEALAAAAPEQRAASAAARAPTQGDLELLSLDEMKKQPHGPLSHVVLEFLTVMDRVVNSDKGEAMTVDDWAPLGELIDRDRFRRVGNFGVRNNWPSYAELLTRWAKSSWWKGYIRRMREVPPAQGRNGLVYLESEERSSQKHPVREGGDYSTLDSIAVYEIDADNKIVGLRVYDQRPL